MRIYNDINKAIRLNKKLLSVLLDPDKIFLPDLTKCIDKIGKSNVTHIFIGGSTVKEHKTEIVVKKIKELTDLPIVIFPGDINQITDEADALLFLNLISGRNPDYLINAQVKAAAILKNINLETISTSYILIGDHNNSAVQKVTKTTPLSFKDVETIVDTALAGQMMGHRLVYLEAGSGAAQAVNYEIIKEVKKAIDIPLVVGGGIFDKKGINNAYDAGADMIVIGTAFEKNPDFFSTVANHIKIQV